VSNELKKQDLLEKLARMQASGMCDADIAVAAGLSASRISQIFKSEEFETAQEIVTSEMFEQQELMNQGWDSVEALGVNKVIEVLGADPDPDFALRAAVLANKAVRRGGGYKNNPISQDAGLKAVIVLNNCFVTKIQERTKDVDAVEDSTDKQDLQTKQKAVNFLAPTDVQDLLALQPDEFAKLENEKSKKIADDLPEFKTLDTESK